ncbi:hypothetical protein SIN8267_01069 [Sinobacterium norvegicum]|uniref:DUF2846 domain-containing protein n=1 Tax=Sinobacterium norvegicum TaxID=1641715 RepID=A0ABN8EH69_9GAMM|nr:hypothetical protein [Sinobacterium norvegicum]CAH0990968.1 hypothetical protein SIN8267_01069 [Sinobacterium norvegicum]
MYRNLLLASLMLLSACTSQPPQQQSLATTEKNTTLTAPPADMAQIVFVRPSQGVLQQSDVELYRISRERIPVAPIESGSKFSLDITPGHYYFMAYQNKTANFIEANVIAGRRYFVLIDAANSKSSQLMPLSQQRYSALNYQQLPLTTTAEIEQPQWFKKNQGKVKKSQIVYWQQWQMLDSNSRKALKVSKNSGIAF